MLKDILSPEIIVTVLGVIGGWFGLSKRSEANLAYAAQYVEGALRGDVAMLLASAKTLDTVRVRSSLRHGAEMVLSRIGVKPSKAVDKLVDLAVEHALSDFIERFLTRQLDELASKTGDVLKAFTPKPAG